MTSARLLADRKALEERLKDATTLLQKEEDRVGVVGRAKAKAESSLAGLEKQLELEVAAGAELDRACRR